MEKYLISLLVFLAPFKSFAESVESVFLTVCVEEKHFVYTLSKYEEYPIARGLSQRILEGESENVLVIFVNTSTRSWTIAEKVDKLYCIVGMGDNFEPLTQTGEQLKY